MSGPSSTACARNARCLPRLLHAILTGMTAGGAVGLGFNRAFLMLADETDAHTEMAVGPTSPSRRATSGRSGYHHTTIGDFLDDYELPPPERFRYSCANRGLPREVACRTRDPARPSMPSIP